MRASRLLAIVLLLQNRGRMSARALAAELEVSVRTIYRDVDALNAAGIPISSDRGPTGGFRLMDGYRTRLTGLTGEEAASLVFAGLPELAAELGLGMVLASAQLKLQAALPVEARARADRVRERFHLDAPGWFQADDPTPHLSAVAQAVWNQQAIRVRYRRWAGEVNRVLEPLGVVLKAGSWYLVARPATTSDVRAYRISRLLELETLPDRFERPDSFDLDVFWRHWARQFESGLYRTEALIRLSPRALEFVARALDPIAAKAVQATAGPAGADGWREAVLPIESIDHAVLTLLRFGADIEVLAPPPLRQQLRQITAEMARLYSTSEPVPQPASPVTAGAAALVVKSQRPRG